MDYRQANCEAGETQIQFLKPGQKFRLNILPYCYREGVLEAVGEGRCLVTWGKTVINKFKTPGGEQEYEVMPTTSNSVARETPVVAYADHDYMTWSIDELKARMREMEGK